MGETKLKISVALCTYNGEKFLQEQLDSIVNQTKKVDQIVLSDDNSADRTLQILSDFKEKYSSEIDIIIINNNPGLGVVKNFEGAIKTCSGDIIFTSDQDDIWHNKKVEKFLNHFNSSDVNLIFSDAQLIDENGQNLGKTLWSTLNFRFVSPNYTKYLLLNHNVVTGATMAFRKELFIDSYPFIDCKKYLLHDYWLALNSRDQILGLNECLTFYRQHQNNVVGATHQKQSLLTKFKHINMLNESIIADYEKYYIKCNYLDEKIHSFNYDNRISNTLEFYEMRKKVLERENSVFVLFRRKYYYYRSDVKKLVVSLVSYVLNLGGN